jgi:hypothetical protein
MVYEEIAEQCRTLSYREKLRLSQQLIQLAIIEEETRHPQSRATAQNKKSPETPNDYNARLQYVIESLPKPRPIKKDLLLHSIKTMHRFKGGISDKDAEEIVADLEKIKFLKIVDNKRVLYLKH